MGRAIGLTGTGAPGSVSAAGSFSYPREGRIGKTNATNARITDKAPTQSSPAASPLGPDHSPLPSLTSTAGAASMRVAISAWRTGD